MKIQDMTQRYRKFKRAWGMWYAFDNATGNSVIPAFFQAEFAFLLLARRGAGRVIALR